MTAGAGPRYVATGPGNTIWFTEETGNRVGRVTGIDLGGGGGRRRRRRWGNRQDEAQLKALKLSAKRVRVGKTLTIRYTLSEPATVTLSLERVLRGPQGRQALREGRSAPTGPASAAPATRARSRRSRSPTSRPGSGDPLHAAPVKPGAPTASPCSARDTAGNRSSARPGPHHRSAAQALAALPASGYRPAHEPVHTRGARSDRARSAESEPARRAGDPGPAARARARRAAQADAP